MTAPRPRVPAHERRYMQTALAALLGCLAAAAGLAVWSVPGRIIWTVLLAGATVVLACGGLAAAAEPDRRDRMPMRMAVLAATGLLAAPTGLAVWGYGWRIVATVALCFALLVAAAAVLVPAPDEVEERTDEP